MEFTRRSRDTQFKIKLGRNLKLNWTVLKIYNLKLNSIEKWTCGTFSIEFKILIHQLTVWCLRFVTRFVTSTLCAATFSNSYVKWRLLYVMLRFVAVPFFAVFPVEYSAYTRIVAHKIKNNGKVYAWVSSFSIASYNG